jgi:hypothetical protein
MGYANVFYLKDGWRMYSAIHDSSLAFSTRRADGGGAIAAAVAGVLRCRQDADLELARWRSQVN